MTNWAANSFFYHIYPLGFCGAPETNDFSSPITNRLGCIYDAIEHMKDLKVNALYLGPVFESTAHGYDTADYYTVDRRLGSNEDLKQLVSTLHDNGIKVILDGVFNHVGRDFWAFKDIQEKQGYSMYCDWIHGLNFNNSSCYGDPFSYSGWEGHYNLVKLNLHNYYVKEHIFKAVEKWIHEFQIDGVRLDVAYSLDLNFLKELRHHCKSIKHDFWLMGETLHGDYRRWVNDEVLDSVTNYECYKGLFSAHNDKNYFEIGSSLARQFGEYGLYKGRHLYNFVDNHDVNRLSSTLHKKSHLYPAYAMLMTMPGIPSVYYGSEWGIEGTKNNGNDRELRPTMHSIQHNGHKKYPELIHAIKRLAEIREHSHALKYGNYHQVGIASEQIAYLRQSNEESVIVAINGSDQPASMHLYNIPVRGNSMVDLLNNNDHFTINGDRAFIDNIPPNWARIMKVQ